MPQRSWCLTRHKHRPTGMESQYRQISCEGLRIIQTRKYIFHPLVIAYKKNESCTVFKQRFIPPTGTQDCLESLQSPLSIRIVSHHTLSSISIHKEYQPATNSADQTIPLRALSSPSIDRKMALYKGGTTGLRTV